MLSPIGAHFVSKMSEHNQFELINILTQQVSVNAGYIEETDDINGYTIISNGSTISVKDGSADVLVQV